MRAVQSLHEELVDWFDPRPGRSNRRLAVRPARADGRRLVLFDNGKLSPPYRRWMPIVAPLESMLERMGTVRTERADLLIEPVADHSARIAAWQDAGVDGVVFALCDAGVAGPTLIFAAATERAGIPTAVLCTDQVIDLLAVSASFMVSGLPLVLLPATRLETPAALVAAVEGIAGELRDALTSRRGYLEARFTTRFPFVSGLARAEGSAAAGAEFADIARRERMTDGLPVVTPTRERVRRAVDAARRAPEDIVIEALAPSGASLNVEQAAACAVMAGVSAERFPLVLAALEAMSAPGYRLHLASVTTHPGGHLALFSGPLARAAGIASGRGCLGPGHEANATLGRAISLTLINVGRAIPGLSTLSALGSPAQFSYCFGDAEDGPLPSLHSRLGDGNRSIVWTLKCEGPHNVMDHLSSTPRDLLTTVASVASTLGSNNAYFPGDLLVILNPEHASVVARAGWKIEDVQQFLWEQARHSRSDLAGRGAKSEWPAQWAQWERLPVVPSPDRIWVVVAGAPGPQSLVVIPWGFADATWRALPEPAST